MIFVELEYHFIWMGLGLPIRLTDVKVHEQLVSKCGGKGREDLRGSTLPRGKQLVKKLDSWWQLLTGEVIKCHHYYGNINAETFADFVEEHFPEMFKV